MVERAYTWHPPKVWHQDSVTFRTGLGEIVTGNVINIKTGYIKGKAFHTYGILRPNRQRKDWIGDHDIIAVRTDEQERP